MFFLAYVILLPYLSSLGLSVCLSIHLYLSIYVARAFLTRLLDQTWFLEALRGGKSSENPPAKLSLVEPDLVVPCYTWLYLVDPETSIPWRPWRRTEAVPSSVPCGQCFSNSSPACPSCLIPSAKPVGTRWEPDGNQHPPGGCPRFPKASPKLYGNIWKIASLW